MYSTTKGKMKDLVFQALSWHAEDAQRDDDDDEGGAPQLQHFIKVFGRAQDGRSVSATITGFTPHFYVKVPCSWTQVDLTRFRTFLSESNKVYRNVRNEIKGLKFVRKKDLIGFTNFKEFQFVRITLFSHRAQRALVRVLSEPVRLAPGQPLITLPIYEANIEPFIKFIHAVDVAPCGWLLVNGGQYTRNASMLQSTCDLDVTVRWQDVRPAHVDTSAPFRIACFDLECSSSHGDFPLAVKDYKRLASQIYDLFEASLKDASKLQATRALQACVLYALGLEPNCEHHDRVDTVHLKAPCTDRHRELIMGMADDMYDTLAVFGRGGSREETIAALNASWSNGGRFPAVQGDAIIQIGTTVHTYGQRECSSRHIVTLGTCAPVRDGSVTVVQAASEEELLMCWREHMLQVDPDMLSGYNIFGFDMAYLHARAKELGIAGQFMQLGRLRDRACAFKEVNLSSSALGDNLLRFIHMEGRVIMDIMKVVQRDHKLDSYKLDAVAQHFTGEKKDDVTPQDIFRLQKGSAEDRAIIATYCVQDCELCNLLIIKLDLLAGNMGMANVCLVPLAYIFMRGQGIKIFSLVLKQCKEDGFLVPVIKMGQPAFGGSEEDGDDSYEGAIVLEPKEGIYIDDPISVLDYASLYPSSMISENISHDCIVMDPAFDNLPGVAYEDITYDLFDDAKRVVGQRTCRFAQSQQGMLPRILTKLLSARKATRKRMQLQRVINVENGTEVGVGFYDPRARTLALEDGAQVLSIPPDAHVEVVQAYNDFQLAMLDGLQNAYKITANSLYGQCGARTSPIHLKDIAACTTATGRKMILMAKAFLESKYDARIVYGDSVASYTPVYVRVGGRLDICAIEHLADKYGAGLWLPCHGGKEACELLGVDTWSDKGWTPLHRVIRHGLAPHKKMVRVMTPTAVVDVTDDHSLLAPDGACLTPDDLRVRMAADATDAPRLMHHDLPPPCDIENDMSVVQARVMGATMYDTVPSSILNAPAHIRRAFWQNLNEVISPHPTTQAQVAWLAQSLGLGTCVNMDGTISAFGRPVTGDHVIRLDALDLYRGFVYDLTTDNHHFAAGVGNMIVHNTDSLFAIFPDPPELVGLSGHAKGKAKLAHSIKVATEASHAIKPMLKRPHDLEYEKSFWPFILLSKKRYVGNMYEQDDAHFKRKSMGIAIKRRDSAAIVKKIYGGVLDIILNNYDVPASITFLKEQLNQLIEGRCPMEDLIITKSLRSDYKNPKQIAHKVLAERMGERDPGNRPQVNDRIPFVYVKQLGGHKKMLQGERIEHPEFVVANKLPIDYEFYITNQVMRPVLQLYACIIDQLQQGTAGIYEDAYREIIAAGGDPKKAKDKIGDMKETALQKDLFDPVFRRLTNIREGNQDIRQFYAARGHSPM